MERPLVGGSVIAALMVTAFVIGLYVRPGTNAGADVDASLAAASNVMTVSGISMNEDGTVAISFSTVDEETVSGPLTDPVVQNLLARALLDGGSPVTRLRAANVIADIEPGAGRTDPDLTLALAALLSEEDNVGIKLQAMQAAARIHPASPLPDVMVRTLTDILQNEENSALRIQALRLLMQSEIASMDLATILRGAQNDDNSFVRRQARNKLLELDESVPLEQITPEDERP
jgi:hypothetical protein